MHRARRESGLNGMGGGKFLSGRLRKDFPNQNKRSASNNDLKFETMDA